MKVVKLVIQIAKPVSEVFAFLLNPQNTPLWIDSIVKEEAKETPVKVGSIYRNQNKEGKWSIYKVISLNKDKSFEFLKNDNNYHVRYTFEPTSSNGTNLEYLEWVETGNLEEPFTIEILHKLKSVLEGR